MDNLDLVPQLPSITVHLSGVDHEPGIIGSGTSHHPLPEYTAGPVTNNSESQFPVRVGQEVTQGTLLRPGHERLVSSLALVVEDRLPARTPVDVSEDMELWRHSPDLL